MGTKDDIVRIATDYIQRNGVNAFSYADIARKNEHQKTHPFSPYVIVKIPNDRRSGGCDANSPCHHCGN